ncbi:MAG TPA: hypothetical protein VHL11_14460 [Phototrophicaceae bacterium]|jgi:hypothetical protein|nr:hypothetical protein [Phototrophicaceae bacterium]
MITEVQLVGNTVMATAAAGGGGRKKNLRRDSGICKVMLSQ